MTSEITNRWSRYIGVMGTGALTLQANASVLVIGLDVAGIEVAKNLALSGLKRLSLIDIRKVSDLSNDRGHFFLDR